MSAKITQLLNHERYQLISVLCCLLLIFWGVCCQSKTKSCVDPTQQVTRPELNAEVETFLALADARYADLDRQDELKALIFEHVSLWTTTGTFNPTALLPLLASVLGVGAVIDNARRRRETQSSSKPAKNPTATNGGQ